VIILSVSAGVCSALGLLRWKDPCARWSFAAVCWLLACIVAGQALWRGTVSGSDETRNGGAM